MKKELQDITLKAYRDTNRCIGTEEFVRYGLDKAGNVMKYCVFFHPSTQHEPYVCRMLGDEVKLRKTAGDLSHDVRFYRCNK